MILLDIVVWKVCDVAAIGGSIWLDLNRDNLNHQSRYPIERDCNLTGLAQAFKHSTERRPRKSCLIS
jgi:hypothetical protein